MALRTLTRSTHNLLSPILVLSPIVLLSTAVAAQTTAPPPAASASPPPPTTKPAPAATVPPSTTTKPAPAATAPASPTTKPAPADGPKPAPKPGPASPAPAAPKPKASAQVKASAKTEGPRPSRTRRSGSSNGQDYERRLVVFTDGPAPRIVSKGDATVHGPVELEVRFRNANPLCYQYSANIAASSVAASDRPLPDRAPGIGAFGALSPVRYATLSEAWSDVNTAQNELDELLHAARFQVSLDDVWASCDAGGPFAAQQARVNAAAKTISTKLGSGGSWRQMLERAAAVSLGARRLARSIETEERNRAQEVETRRAALRAAEDKATQLETRGKTRAVQKQLDEQAVEIASLQRKLREAELGLARQQQAGDLERAAAQLDARVQLAVENLSAMIADVNRARALLARSPTAIRRRFGAGEDISVVVERTRLERGERVDGRGPQLFAVPTFHTLRPITMDIGLGPALTIGQNTAKYETVYAPRDRDDTRPDYRIARTEQGLNLDLMVSISAYIWKRRYLDDGVFDMWQLLPRPMVGVSIARPFEVLYAGLQIDPIQYMNVGGGVRISTEEELVGPQPLDRALLSPEGEPQDPVTRDEVKVSGFISLTVSTNLVYRWLKQGL